MERPEREAFATRFDAYVSELREVFGSRGLRFGRPKDLAAIAQALSVPGALRDDAAAVVRSIVYREHEGLSRAELSSVVMVAAGGADLYASAQEGAAVGQLESFVTGVRLALRMGTDAALEETDKQGPVEASPAVELPLQREEVYADEDATHAPEAAVSLAGRAGILSGVYSQAQEMSQDAGVKGDGTYFLKANAEKESEPAPVEQSEETLEGRASQTYWGWVGGLCVLIALLAAGLFWRHRLEKSAEVVHPEERASLAGSAGGAASSVQGPPLPGQPSSGQSGSVAAVAVPSETPNARDLGGTSGPAGEGKSLGNSLQRGDARGGLQKSGGGVVGFPAQPPASSGPTRTASTGSPDGPIAGGPTQVAESPVKPVARPSPPRPQAVTPTASSSAAAALTPSLGKYVVSSGVMSGHLLSAPAPPYPMMAKMWGVEGQVILQAVISSKGKVVSAHVLDGHKMLRGSAMKAVRRWRYRPYSVDGKPTDVATVVIVEYKLKP